MQGYTLILDISLHTAWDHELTDSDFWCLEAIWFIEPPRNQKTKSVQKVLRHGSKEVFILICVSMCLFRLNLFLLIDSLIIFKFSFPQFLWIHIWRWRNYRNNLIGLNIALILNIIFSLHLIILIYHFFKYLI